MSDHIYSLHWSEQFLRDNTYSFPSSYILFDQDKTEKKKRGIHSIKHLKSKGEETDDDELIDVETCDDDHQVSIEDIGSHSWHCSKSRVLSQMEECSEIIRDKLQPIKKRDAFWDQKLNRSTWSSAMEAVFMEMKEILEIDCLARLAAKNGFREMIQRRLSLDNSAEKTRFLFAKHKWNLKLLVWLHSSFINYLPHSLLTSYCEIIQTLRSLVPELVDELLAAWQNQAPTLDESEHDLDKAAFRSIMTKRTWGPALTAIVNVNTWKLRHPVVVVMAPCILSSSSYPSVSKRFRFWRSLFNQIGNSKLVDVYRNASEHDAISFGAEGSELKKEVQVNEVAIGAIRNILWKIREMKARFSDRKVILVGWNTTSLLNCYVSMMEKVDAVICFGFPTYTMSTMRGTCDDELYAVTTPTYFVTGNQSPTYTPESIENFRHVCFNKATTGQLIVNEANEHLRVDPGRLLKSNCDQYAVDRYMFDHAMQFVSNVFNGKRTRKQVMTPRLNNEEEGAFRRSARETMLSKKRRQSTPLQRTKHLDPTIDPPHHPPSAKKSRMSNIKASSSSSSSKHHKTTHRNRNKTSTSSSLDRRSSNESSVGNHHHPPPAQPSIPTPAAAAVSVPHHQAPTMMMAQHSEASTKTSAPSSSSGAAAGGDEGDDQHKETKVYWNVNRGELRRETIDESFGGGGMTAVREGGVPVRGLKSRGGGVEKRGRGRPPTKNKPPPAGVNPVESASNIDETAAAVATILGENNPTAIAASSPPINYTSSLSPKPSSPAPLRTINDLTPAFNRSNSLANGGVRTVSPAMMNDVTASASFRARGWLSNEERNETREATQVLEMLSGNDNDSTALQPSHITDKRMSLPAMSTSHNEPQQYFHHQLQHPRPITPGRGRGLRTRGGKMSSGSGGGGKMRGRARRGSGPNTRGGGVGNMGERGQMNQSHDGVRALSEGNHPVVRYVYDEEGNRKGVVTESFAEMQRKREEERRQAEEMARKRNEEYQLEKQRRREKLIERNEQLKQKQVAERQARQQRQLKISTCQSWADSLFGTAPLVTTATSAVAPSSLATPSTPTGFKTPANRKFGHALPKKQVGPQQMQGLAKKPVLHQKTLATIAQHQQKAAKQQPSSSTFATINQLTAAAAGKMTTVAVTPATKTTVAQPRKVTGTDVAAQMDRSMQDIVNDLNKDGTSATTVSSPSINQPEQQQQQPRSLHDFLGALQQETSASKTDFVIHLDYGAMGQQQQTALSSSAAGSEAAASTSIVKPQQQSSVATASGASGSAVSAHEASTSEPKSSFADLCKELNNQME